jgi:hypothetical protein
MVETWVRPNRRAIWFGCMPPLIVTLVGAWLVVRSTNHSQTWSLWLGAVLAASGIGIILMLLRQLRRPRIAYHDGQVLFYLQSGPPFAVPADVVEAFFLGQGPAVFTGGAPSKHETVNLVVRLSQRETAWARRDVKPALGNWCDGYVTVRGTWSEPLVPELIRQLNRRLKVVKSQNEGKDER